MVKPVAFSDFMEAVFSDSPWRKPDTLAVGGKICRSKWFSLAGNSLFVRPSQVSAVAGSSHRVTNWGTLDARSSGMRSTVLLILRGLALNENWH